MSVQKILDQLVDLCANKGSANIDETYLSLVSQLNAVMLSNQPKSEFSDIESWHAQEFFHNITSGIHIYHLENLNDDTSLRMVAANKASEQLTGVAVTDVVGKTIDQNFPGLREKGIPQMYAEVVRTQKNCEIEDIYYSDERVVAGAFSVRAFPLPGNKVGVSFENITSRKIAEEKLVAKNKEYHALNEEYAAINEELKENIEQLNEINLRLSESEARFRSLIEVLPDTLIVHAEGKIKYANPAALKLLKINSEDEIIGKNPMDFVHPDHKEIVLERIRSAVQNRTFAPPFVEKFVRPNGEVFFVEVSAVPILFNGKNAMQTIIRDITEKLQMEEILKKREMQFRLISELITDYVFRVRVSADGTSKLEWISDNYHTERNRGKNEIVTPQSWVSVIHPDYREGFMKLMNDVIVERKGISYECKSLLVNGGERWINVFARPEEIGAQSGHDFYIIGAVKDITARKEYELKLAESEKMLKAQNEEYLSLNEELIENNKRIQHINQDLIRAKQKAEESDKLKSAFLANMSHEIRTPMNSIVGFSNLLHQADLSEDKRQKFINVINKSSKQLLSLISDIIDISKIEAGSMQVYDSACNLNSLFKELLAQFDFLKNEACKYEIQLLWQPTLSDSDCNIWIDENKLKQIITNFFGNALKFTDTGFIELGYKLSATEVIVYVKDTGIGIKDENLKLIFERFRQVEDHNTRKFGGTGLGLAICSGLASLMNGRLWVESEFGKGSTFYFAVERKKIEENVEETEHLGFVTESQFSWHGKTILIVDDVPEIHDFFTMALDDTGVKIISAHYGNEAINICRNNPGIDLVLLDLQLTDISGYDVAKELKRFKKTLPVIAQTAYALSDDRKKALKAGCDDYLPKPVDLQLLWHLLDKYLKK